MNTTTMLTNRESIEGEATGEVYRAWGGLTVSQG